VRESFNGTFCRLCLKCRETDIYSVCYIFTNNAHSTEPPTSYEAQTGWWFIVLQICHRHVKSDYLFTDLPFFFRKNTDRFYSAIANVPILLAHFTGLHAYFNYCCYSCCFRYYWQTICWIQVLTRKFLTGEDQSKPSPRSILITS